MTVLVVVLALMIALMVVGVVSGVYWLLLLGGIGVLSNLYSCSTCADVPSDADVSSSRLVVISTQAASSSRPRSGQRERRRRRSAGRADQTDVRHALLAR